MEAEAITFLFLCNSQCYAVIIFFMFTPFNESYLLMGRLKDEKL